MSIKKSYIKIGKISSTHGVKGDVIFIHFLKNAKDIINWKAVMIELNTESYIPFFVENIKELNDTDALCKFEEIDTPEQAKEILNCNVYAPLNVNPKLNIDNSWETVIGFSLNDETSSTTTKIIGVQNIAGQMFFNVNVNDADVLIPVHENLILNVDAHKQEIVMQLPDGFFETFG